VSISVDERMPRLLDDPRWLETERRDIFLRGLLKANDWIATREVVEAVRSEFRIGGSTAYRMIARFPRIAKGIEFDADRSRHSRCTKRLNVRTERLIGRQELETRTRTGGCLRLTAPNFRFQLRLTLDCGPN
jgi:hypothetical protein